MLYICTEYSTFNLDCKIGDPGSKTRDFKEALDGTQMAQKIVHFVA